MSAVAVHQDSWKPASEVAHTSQAAVTSQVLIRLKLDTTTCYWVLPLLRCMKMLTELQGPPDADSSSPLSCGRICEKATAGVAFPPVRLKWQKLRPQKAPPLARDLTETPQQLGGECEEGEVSRQRSASAWVAQVCVCVSLSLFVCTHTRTRVCSFVLLGDQQNNVPPACQAHQGRRCPQSFVVISYGLAEQVCYHCQSPLHFVAQGLLTAMLPTS